MPRDMFGDVVAPNPHQASFPRRFLAAIVAPFSALSGGVTVADRAALERFRVALQQEETPPELSAEFEGMWRWALNNRRSAKRAGLLFWALKIPALAFASVGGLLTYLDIKALAIGASTVASFCILLDALQPRGRLRNAHLRAFHEITNKLSESISEWRVARLTGSATPAKAAEIIVRARQDAKSIERFIEDAAASLDDSVDHSSQKHKRT